MMLARRCLRLLVLALVASGVLLAAVAAAPAFAESAWWQLDSTAAPTHLRPGEKEDKIIVTATNLGDGTVDASHSPVRITDVLPAGLKATAIAGRIGSGNANGKKGVLSNMTCPEKVTSETTLSLHL